MGGTCEIARDDRVRAHSTRCTVNDTSGVRRAASSARCRPAPAGRSEDHPVDTATLEGLHNCVLPVRVIPVAGCEHGGIPVPVRNLSSHTVTAAVEALMTSSGCTSIVL